MQIEIIQNKEICKKMDIYCPKYPPYFDIIFLLQCKKLQNTKMKIYVATIYQKKE